MDDETTPAAPAQAPTGNPAPGQPGRPGPAAKKAPARRTTSKTAAKKAPAAKAVAKTAAKPAVKSGTKPAAKRTTRKAPATKATAGDGLRAHVPDAVAEAPAATPTGPASAEEVEAAWKDNTLAQVLYHDWEAGTYDEKWSISFDERCITYAQERFSHLVGADVLRAERRPYAKALEIGAGTGFFSLNLKQAGVLDEVYVTDVSPGMVDAAKRNARQLGFEVQGEAAFAENLPYPDDTFDVVVGHAVIHHIPDVEEALREILRVLKPGGRFVIAGEPTRIGDWYARRLGQVTWKLTTAITGLPRLRERWAKSQEELDASSRAAALEAVVDLHTFVPEELAAMANRAGAQNVHTQTEEFLAALLGWPVRTFEAAVNPERLGWGWAMFAYKSWLRLSSVDRVLSRALPKGVFYNVGITGTKK